MLSLGLGLTKTKDMPIEGLGLLGRGGRSNKWKKRWREQQREKKVGEYRLGGS